jgi:4-alpha-glucanotransferase
MNMPGSNTGNWQWRFDWSDVPAGLAGRLRHLMRVYGR